MVTFNRCWNFYILFLSWYLYRKSITIAFINFELLFCFIYCTFYHCKSFYFILNYSHLYLQISMLCSVLYHLFGCRSSRTYENCLKLDVFSIYFKIQLKWHNRFQTITVTIPIDTTDWLTLLSHNSQSSSYSMYC